MLSVIAMTIVIFFHGRVIIKVEGDLSLKHMMRLALTEIAHLTLDDFFSFSYVHSLASQGVANCRRPIVS